MPDNRKDLVVLVEGKDDEQTIRALLERRASLGIRVVSHDVFIHPESGSGCVKADLFLRSLQSSYRYALVLLDLEGSGRDALGRDDLQNEIENRLRAHWQDRAAVIVIEPELEIWVWSGSPHVDRILGWENRHSELQTMLVEKGFWNAGEAKPHRPKEACDFALRTVRKQRSSAIFGQMAQNVGLHHCTDRAFESLKTILTAWFGS